MSVEARGILPPLPLLAERRCQSPRPHGNALPEGAGNNALGPFELPASSEVGPAPRPVPDARAVPDEGDGAELEDSSTTVLAQAAWAESPAFTPSASPEDKVSGPWELEGKEAPTWRSEEAQHPRPNPASPRESAPHEHAPLRADMDAAREAAQESGSPLSTGKAPPALQTEAAPPASAREGASVMKEVRVPQGGGSQAAQDLARLSVMVPRQESAQHQNASGTLRWRSPRGKLALLATGPAPSPAGSLQGAEAAQRTLSRWREFRAKEARGGSGAPTRDAKPGALSHTRGSDSRHSPGMEGAWQGPALGRAPASTPGLLLPRLATSAAVGRMKAAADLGRLLEQVRGRVERLQLEGGGRVELRLDPAELGSLDLHLAKEGSGWRLEIVASRAETAQELLRQAKDLQEQLARAGLRLDELRLGEALPTRQGVGTPPREGHGSLPGQGRESRHGDGEARQEAEGLEADGEGSPRRQEDFASRLGKLIRTQSRKGQPS